jgi:hypothetical protein
MWLVLALLVGLLLGPLFLKTLRPSRDHTVDFFQEWASAKNLLSGLPIYTSQSITRTRYVGETRSDLPIPVEVNAHPPTSVLLALPLAWLDYPDAVLAWNLISLVALCGSLLLVMRELRMPLSPWSVIPLLVLLMMCVPLWIHLAFGQLGLVLLLLITATWVAERSGRPGLAGVLLGVATAIKLFPGFLFLYFAVRRQWRALAAGALSLAAVTLLTASILGVEAYRTYVQEVLPQVSWFRAGWNNASVLGFWSKLLDPAPEKVRSVWRTEPLWQSTTLARAGWLVTCAALTLILVLVIRKANSREQCDRAFGATVIAMLLVSPVAWEHYFVILLLPVALLWVAFPKRPRTRAAFLLVQALLFFLPPVDLHGLTVPGGFPNGLASPAHTLTVLSFQFYALLGLYTLAVRSTRPGWEGSTVRPA